MQVSSKLSNKSGFLIDHVGPQVISCVCLRRFDAIYLCNLCSLVILMWIKLGCSDISFHRYDV